MRRCDARVSRVAGLSVVVLGGLLLANCTQSGTRLSSRVDPKYGVSASPRVVQPGQPVPKGGGTYLVGKPYVVAGRTYYPAENKHYRRVGTASWYGEDFHGRLTANGEIYDMGAISAAHPTLPLPSYARVTNLRNGRSLIVRVNDRGPFHDGREIDLSRRAAELLKFAGRGTTPVKVEYVGPASLDGSDDRKLMATLREGGPAPVSRSLLASGPGPDALRRVARAEPRQAAGGQHSPAANEEGEARSAGPEPARGAAPEPAPAPRAAETRIAGVLRESPREAEEIGLRGPRNVGRGARGGAVVAEPLPPPRALADAGPAGRAGVSDRGPGSAPAPHGASRTDENGLSWAESRRYAVAARSEPGLRLPPPRRTAEAERAEAGPGTRNAPRLVWQAGPAPARIESSAYYVVPDDPPTSGTRAANGRGLY